MEREEMLLQRARKRHTKIKFNISYKRKDVLILSRYLRLFNEDIKAIISFIDFTVGPKKAERIELLERCINFVHHLREINGLTDEELKIPMYEKCYSQSSEKSNKFRCNKKIHNKIKERKGRKDNYKYTDACS